jgi:NMD protein affecting ribosome stability and mRNA decay
VSFSLLPPQNGHVIGETEQGLCLNYSTCLTLTLVIGMIFIGAETRKYCSNRKAYRKPKIWQRNRNEPAINSGMPAEKSKIQRTKIIQKRSYEPRSIIFSVPA